jgi:hypothetical protein
MMTCTAAIRKIVQYATVRRDGYRSSGIIPIVKEETGTDFLTKLTRHDGDVEMKKTFRWRVFISFGLLTAFLMLLVSGVILYISPPGRVANWTGWQLLGLTKSGWQHQHIIFGFAFALLSICHLFLINWKTFLCYLKMRTKEGFKSPAELIAILLLSSVFGIGTYFGIQPFSAIFDFGRGISNSWEQKEKQAPVPHAELMTLTELSLQSVMADNPVSLQKKLENAGLKVASLKQTLAEIAAANGMTAEKVYEILVPAEKKQQKQKGEGFGQKTIRQAADEAGVSATSLQLALRQKGIEAGTETSMKTIAENNGMQMRELRELLESITH